MQTTSNSAHGTFGWRLVEFVCLALAAVAPDFITPTQALLVSLSIELLRGHIAIARHVLVLYAITFALQQLRSDSSWWHAVILCVVAMKVAPMLARHQALRLAYVYYLCLNVLLAIVSATGLQQSLPSINIFKTLGVDQASSTSSLMLSDRVSSAFANTCLPLPDSFAPAALFAHSDSHDQALFVLAIILLFAIFATYRHSIKATNMTVLLAAASFIYFAPPTTIEIWTPSATDGWLVLNVHRDGGVVMREPYADEALPSSDLAFVERHPLRAPIEHGAEQWRSMLELWSTASCDAGREHKDSHRSYLDTIRYSVDIHGYLVIAPLP